MSLEPATTKLIERFTITRINAGCLEDIACPECGWRGPFQIHCNVVEVVDDNGATETVGDTEYDKDSWCHCRDGCGHQDELRAFTFPGLDAQLNEQAANRAVAAKAVRKKSWLRNIKVEDTL